MTHICYKPFGICKTCEHFRYDVDKGSLVCFALLDRQQNELNNQEENNEN